MGFDSIAHDVDFEMKYKFDGYDIVATGNATVSTRSEDHYQDTSDFRSVRVSRDISIALQNVQDYKVTYRKENSVVPVTTTRKVSVPDFTFASIADGRKRAGAPKESTFALHENIGNDQLLTKKKYVTFTWDETL